VTTKKSAHSADYVRTGISVTEGTGHVGNTIVEVEVKRAGEKRKSKSPPKPWECGKRALSASFPRRCGLGLADMKKGSVGHAANPVYDDSNCLQRCPLHLPI
jgi:hypothetical protein